jgi:hypothetical protein
MLRFGPPVSAFTRLLGSAGRPSGDAADDRVYAPSLYGEDS